MKQSDDESIHSVPFDPVRDSLLSATRSDWEWLEAILADAKAVKHTAEHAKGWSRVLSEVREGLNHAAPKPIPGYRKLSDDVIASIARIKEMEERMLRTIDELSKLPSVHQHWLHEGQDHLQVAFMCLVRAFARPERVKLPGDQ